MHGMNKSSIGAVEHAMIYAGETSYSNKIISTLKATLGRNLRSAVSLTFVTPPKPQHQIQKEHNI